MRRAVFGRRPPRPNLTAEAHLLGALPLKLNWSLDQTDSPATAGHPGFCGPPVTSTTPVDPGSAIADRCSDQRQAAAGWPSGAAPMCSSCLTSKSGDPCAATSTRRVVDSGTMCRMGLLCEYFVAPSDEDAAATIDHVGGPGRLAALGVPQGRGGLFRRPGRPGTRAESTETHPTVNGCGVEPIVQMGTLEVLLTGRSFDDVLDALAEPVAVRDGGERLVARLSDRLASALAIASDGDLTRVAEPWSQTEEFWGEGDPVVLAVLLRDLAGLARLARDRRQAMYCWLCV